MQQKNPYKVIFFLLGIVLIILLRNVFALVFLGILLGTVFSIPVSFLSRFMPRGLAVILILLLGGGLLSGVGYLASQPISEQVRELKDRIPDAINRAKKWIPRTNSEEASNASKAESPIPATIQKQNDLLGSVLSRAEQAAGGLISVFSAIIIVVVLAAFFAHSPETYHDALLALVPKDWEKYFEELWRRLEIGLKHWIGGILVSMTIMGTLTGIGLALSGIRQWPLLGLLTFLGTFIPYVGAISSAIPGLLLALAQSSEKFLAALGVYLAIHIIEGYVVQPFVMKRAVVIRPAVLLIWQVAMVALAGIYGIIIATPFLVCVKIALGYLYIEKTLGKRAASI